jgi:hypothetical protein
LVAKYHCQNNHYDVRYPSRFSHNGGKCFSRSGRQSSTC